MSNGKQISQTILEQLGGGEFRMMVGAKTFTYDHEGTTNFKIGQNRKRINVVRVFYNYNSDDYTMEFGRIRKHTYKTIERVENIYCDQLTETFERVTGMVTALGLHREAK